MQSDNASQFLPWVRIRLIELLAGCQIIAEDQIIKGYDGSFDPENSSFPILSIRITDSEGNARVTSYSNKSGEPTTMRVEHYHSNGASINLLITVGISLVLLLTTLIICTVLLLLKKQGQPSRCDRLEPTYVPMQLLEDKIIDLAKSPIHHVLRWARKSVLRKK
ncbi:hypothetical protein QAD02_008256 [Eretmocerus hayati]|uniref:Uncharacterized protein n=1 Tax=Eretmocerus hayati TaxID=131215 RepID=A0ACC2N5X9_9HYME|nr:hypothetical protein QAD02_008256 [Eretmocerus hayati]